MPNDRETQLAQQAVAAGITSRKELANFMAQVSHESGGLTRLEEGFRYTKGIQQIPVRSAMREGAEVLEAARVDALSGKPEKLAELMYGGRMGNDQPGDGYVYRGRGYMQLTGKDNYRAAGEALGLDLVENPDLAADPENAAKIATWFWKQNVPQAAREDVTAATQAINGGLNGLADRQTRYDDWHKTLTPEFMQAIGVGRQALLAPLLNDPRHTDYALFRAAADGVYAIDAQHNRSSDLRSDQLAASLAVAAKQGGLHEIDHVVMSAGAHNTFAIQGRLDNPAQHRAMVETVPAMDTPLSQSTQQMAQLEAEQAQKIQRPAMLQSQVEDSMLLRGAQP